MLSGGGKYRGGGEPAHLVRARLVASLLAVPAAVTLAASPALAAGPGLHWVAMCTGGGPGWIALPLSAQSPGDSPDWPAAAKSCAHAVCPRGDSTVRKPRLPA